MITAVDTNIMLDLLLPDEPHGQAALDLLDRAAQAGAVVMSEPVYAELALSFPDQRELDQFLGDAGLQLVGSRASTLYRAGMAWRDYTRRRPAALACPRCGNQQEVQCTRCGASLRPRQHIVADFIIGAHALLQADRLLTRDRRYYGTYFPDLTVG